MYVCMYVYISFKYKLLQLLSQLKDGTLFKIRSPILLAGLELYIVFDPNFDFHLKFLD